MNGDSESIKECLDILNDSMEILQDLEFDLKDEVNTELVPDLKLHHLYDMADDVAESTKLRRAESNFVKRKSDL